MLAQQCAVKGRKIKLSPKIVMPSEFNRLNSVKDLYNTNEDFRRKVAAHGQFLGNVSIIVTVD